MDDQQLQDALKERSKKENIIAKITRFSVPIAITLVFIGLVIFGIVPKFFSIQDIKSEISDREGVYELRKRKLDKLEELSNDMSSVNQMLSSIERAFPSGQTSVSEFSLEIEREAERVDLERGTIKSGETVEEEKEDEDTTGQEAVSLEVNNEGDAIFLAIPANIELNGSLGNFLQYLENLRDTPEFLVFDEVELSLYTEEGKSTTPLDRLVGGLYESDVWNGKITVNSYNFSETAFREETPPDSVTFLDHSALIEEVNNQ